MWKPKTGNIFNKHYAHVISSADAYVSGFFYVWFSLPPIFDNAALIGDLKPQDEEILTIGREMANKILVATCVAVPTLPTFTVNKATTLGMNNIKAGHPTNMDVADTITLRFTEIMDLPVFKILSFWASIIRDPELGVSRLAEGAYTKENFSACLLYWTTMPNSRDIQYCGHFTGLFPQKDPRELYTGDYSASDKLDVEIDFNIDRYRINYPWMIDKARTLTQVVEDERKAIINVDGSIC